MIMRQMSYGQILSSMLYRGSLIAFYSPPTSFELFYICNALDFGTAAEDMVGAYNHHISMGNKYILCNYLEKKSEKKSKIIYKILPKIVFVLLAQFVTPMVELNYQLSLSSAD